MCMWVETITFKWSQYHTSYNTMENVLIGGLFGSCDSCIASNCMMYYYQKIDNIFKVSKDGILKEMSSTTMSTATCVVWLKNITPMYISHTTVKPFLLRLFKSWTEFQLRAGRRHIPAVLWLVTNFSGASIGTSPALQLVKHIMDLLSCCLCLYMKLNTHKQIKIYFGFRKCTSI